MSPKRSIKAKEEKVSICFLYADREADKFFGVTNIGQHSRLLREEELLSSAMVNTALTCTMDDRFLNQIREAGKQDDKWSERIQELVRREAKGEKMPDDWTESNGLLCYKNELYIPENETLQTEIAQSCHDSRVAGHFGQEKTIERVTRNFYWKGLADCIKDYVQSCDECQHNC